jgi:primosomal protein N' (replication factor Y)
VGVVDSIIGNQPEKEKRFKIKEIEGIIYPESVFSKEQLRLVSFIASHYYAPFASVVFAMLPHYLRKLKRMPKLIEPVTTNQKSRQPEIRSPKTTIRRRYLLLDPQNKYSSRIYTEAIRKTLAQKRNVLFLLPDTSLSIAKEISRLSRRSLILTSGKKEKRNFEIWLAIKQGKYNLVVGSHLALFSPLNDVGLVIVHHEYDQMYKNDQLPKYNLRDVAKELARLHKATLILQAEIPSLETYFEAKLKKLDLIPYRNLNQRLGLNRPRIKIVDLRSERSIISQALQKKLASNLKQKKKTLIFLNRKGYSRFYICNDCGFSKHLAVGKTSPAICPECQGTNTKEHSFGTERLEFELKKICVRARFFRLDQEVENKEKNLGTAVRQAEIVIATTKILNLDVFFDTVIAALAEIGQSLPDFRSYELNLQNLSRVLRLGKEKIIQTFYPENRVIKALLEDNYKDFLDEELEIRKENSYPPYAKVIRLTMEKKRLVETDKEALELTELMRKLNPEAKQPTEILGPAQVFIPPSRGYEVEIVLKGKNPYPLLSIVPDDWKVDVDPVELLK